jgi:hypothetical protein
MPDRAKAFSVDLYTDKLVCPWERRLLTYHGQVPLVRAAGRLNERKGLSCPAKDLAKRQPLPSIDILSMIFEVFL